MESRHGCCIVSNCMKMSQISPIIPKIFSGERGKTSRTLQAGGCAMRSGHAFVVDCNFRFVLVSPTSKASILPLMMSCIMRPVVLYLAQLIRAYSVLYLTQLAINDVLKAKSSTRYLTKFGLSILFLLCISFLI